MATYRLCVVCTLLCIAYAVISVKISAITWGSDSNNKRELELSENIIGDKWLMPRILFLQRLVEGNSLPKLTLENIETSRLAINNISLENVPVFQNVSVAIIEIDRNKIKYVPTNAFNVTRLQTIFLRNNGIQNMSVNSINTGITYVNLLFNKLTEFSQDWFQDPSLITHLELGGNRIENIQDHAFNQMIRLDSLGLSYNCIKRIGSETFTPGIIRLSLQFNSIEELTVDMFVTRARAMVHLYIHYNQLNFLSEELMLRLKLKYISLRGNPWQCKCLENIERWIHKRNIRRDKLPVGPSEPICVVPSNFPNVCVPFVDKELQQTYARVLSPVRRCLGKSCESCSNLGLEL